MIHLYNVYYLEKRGNTFSSHKGQFSLITHISKWKKLVYKGKILYDYVNLEKVKLYMHLKYQELPEVQSEKEIGTSEAQGIFLR